MSIDVREMAGLFETQKMLNSTHTNIIDLDAVSVLSGLRTPVEQKLQIWIDYGWMLAQCPYTQRKQIGKWVREQGLDFVEDNKYRAAAKKLAILKSKNPLILSDCPYSHPIHAVQWLRKMGRIESKSRN